MSRALAGVLTTIPFLCMGLLALVGPALVDRSGLRRVIAGSLLLIGTGTLRRAVMPTGALVVAATLPIGIGIALAGVALPVVVKQYFPRRGGGATGAYVTVMNFGAALMGLFGVSLAALLGGWRAAFAVSALPAAVALFMWLRVMNREAAAARVVAGAERAVVEQHAAARRLRAPTAIAVVLALVFGLQSAAFSGLITWVGDLYRDAGSDAGDAAIVTAALLILSIPASIVMPALSDGRDRRIWAAASAAVAAAGLAGIATMPLTLPWLWITLYALGNGALFPLVLTLPLDLSPGGERTAHLVAWTLGLGYSISCLAPVAVGELRDASGGFEVPMLVLTGCLVMSGLLVMWATERRAGLRADGLPATLAAGDAG
jgi:CP family cyanate transporter-like MFS transporter